eukprot:2336837-Ditylum_brightwellii.AAC.1
MSGHTTKSLRPATPLPHFEEHFCQEQQQGRHHKSHMVCHVSAKHHLLSPTNKETWDATYKEEYNGLNSLSTWGLITQQQYGSLFPLYGNVISTMTLATLQYDKNGLPKQAKYRIAALGNL